MVSFQRIIIWVFYFGAQCALLLKGHTVSVLASLALNLIESDILIFILRKVTTRFKHIFSLFLLELNLAFVIYK